MLVEQQKNNFDFLRLLFATFVIITHAYPLSGIEECDLLCQISNKRLLFSAIGVNGFFVISGYLIFQSLERSNSIVNYYKKRILRIFPALAVVLLLTVLFILFIYDGDISVSNWSLLTYIPNNISLYRLQYTIDGVFENNPYTPAINGSLWTIPYEFTMYIFLSALFMFRKNRQLSRNILLICFFCFMTLNFYDPFSITKKVPYLSGSILSDVGSFFLAGALLATIRIERIKNKNIILLLATVLFTVSVFFDVYFITKYILLPLVVILLGLYPIRFLSDIGKKTGDISYGIYLYGFPVQQTLVHYFKMNHVELMIYGFIISGMFAYASWHLVEKKALKLKREKIPVPRISES